MRKLAYTLAAAAMLAAVPAQSQAQTVVGPYLAYHDDFDLGVGGFVAIPIPSLHENVSLLFDFGYFFPGDLGLDDVDFTYWELNAGGLVRFPIDNEDISPFAFGGLNIARFGVSDDVEGLDYSDGDTEIGLNLGGGITFIGLGNLRPSVGAKVELSGGEGFVLFGALGFPVGGPSNDGGGM